MLFIILLPELPINESYVFSGVTETSGLSSFPLSLLSDGAKTYNLQHNWKLESS